MFLLGDTIDRGPESRALLEWVLDTDWVYSVMGNHELMFIAGTEDNRNRYKHRGMGGHWTASLDFFFQAEDGIRCLYVTGVQTCALPIWDIAHVGDVVEFHAADGLVGRVVEVRGAGRQLERGLRGHGRIVGRGFVGGDVHDLAVDRKSVV